MKYARHSFRNDGHGESRGNEIDSDFDDNS